MRQVEDTAAAFKRILPAIETELDRVLPEATPVSSGVHQAMRYSVLAGGKRLRPLLCIAAYRTFRPDWERILPLAASLELIHTYSLIHDDLPSMDDDDFRRGLPSCHRQFGEAIAVLAGDGLLTLAFETVAGMKGFPAERVLEALSRVGRAAGTLEGMIAGQAQDLEAEGSAVDREQLEVIHRRKTGALLEASVSVGAYLSGATKEQMVAVDGYGREIGLAFQVVDDILDETAPVTELGKTPGKDRDQQKATYPGLYGIDSSRRIVTQLTARARASVRPLGEKGQLLLGIADYLEGRGN